LSIFAKNETDEMKRKWKLKELTQAELVSSLSEELQIDKILATLLVMRGVSSYDEARLFFRPSLEHLHDPFLMKDMDKAVKRIQDAIANEEKILIYGDYDVDGTTAVALLYSYLANIYDKIDFYIPDRYDEGYGISYQGVDFAETEGFSLIVTLDCGIKANEQIAYANQKGIDVVVTDHHIEGDELPAAFAILNPKRTDCPYPDKDLSGCGVGFKLAQAFGLKSAIRFEEAENYMDLVAISIASDIVPIKGENRIMAYYGMRALNDISKRRIGLNAIIEPLNIKKEITVTDVVFSIGPRLNAAGRINTGRAAVELMVAKDQQTAEEYAKILNDDNVTRKELDTDITKNALELIAGNEELLKAKATILFDKDWSKGVLGIVASRLTEHYYRPTIVLTESDGLYTGSARSVKGYDLYAALENCVELMEHFGGHKYAAGLAIKPENYAAFCEKFERIVSETITDDMLVPEIEIDAEINLSEITPKFYNILRQFAPFGPENMKPVFVTRNVSDKGYAKIVGTDHLKMTIVSDDFRHPGFNAIAFKQGHFLDIVRSNQTFDICYTIEENIWNGQTNLQLNIKDIAQS